MRQSDEVSRLHSHIEEIRAEIEAIRSCNSPLWSDLNSPANLNKLPEIYWGANSPIDGNIGDYKHGPALDLFDYAL